MIPIIEIRIIIAVTLVGLAIPYIFGHPVGG